MKKVIILTVAILFASCAGDGQHPDFEKNVELSKKFFSASWGRELQRDEGHDAR